MARDSLIACASLGICLGNLARLQQTVERIPLLIFKLPRVVEQRGNDVFDVNFALDIDVDYTVIDAPPHLGDVMQAIIGIADLIIVPCPASGADIVATAAIMNLINQARIIRKNDGPDVLMVPSRVDRRTASGREIEAALEQFGEPIGPAVCQREAFVDAFGAGMWIGEYAPKSKAHQEIQDLAVAVKAKRRRRHGAKAA